VSEKDLSNFDINAIKGKRVCFISPNAFPLLDSSVAGGCSGGAEAQFVTMAKELVKMGLEVHFIVGDYGQAEQVTFEGINVHRASFRYMGGSKKYLIPDWIILYRLLKKIQADFHFIKVPRHLLLLLGIYCKFNHAKLIFVGQKDNDLDEQLVRSLDGPIGWFLYRKGINLVRAIVAQTEVQKKGFKALFNKESIVVRNVLTLEDEDVQEKDDYILWVGNSSTDKQGELVPEIARRLPEINFKMIMSISPSQKDDTFVSEQAKTLENFDYIGSVPFSEISRYYKRSRVFISTSKCEGFPNTFLQSWQYKTPVVSLLVDPDGVIEKHQLGFLSGDMDTMVNNIKTIYNDADLLDKLSKNSYRYAYDYHSLDSAVKNYCQLMIDLSK